MSKPAISVIIPSYNRAHILLKSVQSVLSQTYTNIELIIVDDASTDNTAEIVTNIKDSRVKYICLDRNSGACAARNRGIREASGDCIAFNDSDDQWHPDKLERQLAFLEKNNADVVICSMDCYDEDEKNFLHTFPKAMPEGPVTYENLLVYNCSSTQLLVGKAECFKNVLFDEDMPRLQDWDELLRLSQKYKIFRQNDILVDTFMQKDSITRHPEKGTAAMNRLLTKHHDAVFSDTAITEAFFTRKLGFELAAGRNPVEELRILYACRPSARTGLKLVLAKIGLYKFFAKT